jgi:hypothetical protein
MTDTTGLLQFEHGSWSIMQGNECLVYQYEMRAQELRTLYDYQLTLYP